MPNPLDLERSVRAEIEAALARAFSGRALLQLVEALLIADGYATWPVGDPHDTAIDLFAAREPIELGGPRSGVRLSDGLPLDDRAVDQLVDAMLRAGMDRGLLVSWSGFPSSTLRLLEDSTIPFTLWDGPTLTARLLQHYERLPLGIRVEVPLKRIWIPASLQRGTS